jgi:hypothetical protein
MKPLEPVLAVVPGLQGAARSDVAGNVLELAGTLDGESICAVATMCRASLEKASEILGLGQLRDWSFSYAQGALYVHQDGEGSVAVLGGQSKNPETVMKKIAQTLGDKA